MKELELSTVPSLFFPWQLKINQKDTLKGDKYDDNTWLSTTLAQRHRLYQLQRYILLYASFAGLLRVNLTDTFGIIDMLHTMNKDHFPPNLPDDMVFHHLLNLLVGIQNHYTGHLDAAIHYYSLIPPQAGDTYILALLNKSIILRVGTEKEKTIAAKLLDEIERRIVLGSTSAPQLKAAWCLVRGISSTEVLRSKFVPHPPDLGKTSN